MSGDVPDPRLHRVFLDLEAEFEAELRAEAEQEAVQAVRAEAAEIPLWEQLARRAGFAVVVRVGAAVCHGSLLAGYQDFFAVQTADGATHLVRHAAATVAIPTGQPGRLQPAPTARVFGFALALRELARRREPVLVRLVDGSLVGGTVEVVGSDYLELAEHDPGEARRERAVRSRRFCPFTAVAMVSLLPDR